MDHVNNLIKEIAEFSMSVEFDFMPDGVIIKITDDESRGARVCVSRDVYHEGEFSWVAYYKEAFYCDYYLNNINEYREFWRIERMLDEVDIYGALSELNGE